MSSGPVARFDHPGENIAVDPDRGVPSGVTTLTLSWTPATR
jgi:hypothetical protein